jgi:acyl-ACP thioesterase
MYEFDSRVRYSEVDSKGELTWLALMDYFQDCSVFHSEQENLSVEYLAEHHIAWVLSSWQICRNRMPRLAEQITTQTWAYGMKGFYGYRNFVMKDGQGETLAYANSVWVLVDTQSGRPVRVPDEMGERYGIEPKLPMERAPRRIALPEAYEERETLSVPSFFIDTNQHMNNSHYVEVALGFVPEDFVIREVRVEYRRAAKEGDLLCPRVGSTAYGMVTTICDEEGQPYAVVEFVSEHP